MNPDAARTWVIKASLLLTTAVFAVLIVGSGAGVLPLDPATGDLMRLLEILLPVFVGYLGAAAHFVFRPAAATDITASAPLPSNAVLLIKGPLYAWCVMCVLAFGMFWWTNRPAAPQGIGWSVDLLAGILTGTLSLQTATTSIAVAYLFSVDSAQRKEPAGV